MSSHFLTYRLGKGIPGGDNRMSQGMESRSGDGGWSDAGNVVWDSTMKGCECCLLQRPQVPMGSVGPGVAVKVWIVVQQAWAPRARSLPSPMRLVAAATPGT